MKLYSGKTIEELFYKMDHGISCDMEEDATMVMPEIRTGMIIAVDGDILTVGGKEVREVGGKDFKTKRITAINLSGEVVEVSVADISEIYEPNGNIDHICTDLCVSGSGESTWKNKNSTIGVAYTHVWQRPQSKYAKILQPEIDRLRKAVNANDYGNAFVDGMKQALELLEGAE